MNILDKIEADLNEIKNLLKEKQEQEQILTTKQVAELLQVDRTTVYTWSESGKLKSYGLGKRIYYKRSEVMAALVQIRGKAA